MVFVRAVAGDRVLPHTVDFCLDQGPRLIDHERGVTPVREDRVRTPVPALLRQAYEPGHGVMAMGEYEVARDQVLRLRTGAVPLGCCHF